MSLQHEKPHNNTKTEIVQKTEELTNKIDLKDPKLLDTIARRYERNVVGETKKIKTLVCCLLSKDLPTKFRISPIISNSSSTGKSYFLNNILEPFRDRNNEKESSVVDYTDFTEAYFKRAFTNVDGKIIKLEQLERRDEKGHLSFKQLKHLLSEGELRIGNVETNDKGIMQPKDFVIKGVPIIVTTATEFNIDVETVNRLLVLQLDESEEQTKRITNYTLSDYSQISENNNDNDVEELRKLFQSLKEISYSIDTVVIPFTEKIEKILPNTLEMRRDLKKILNLTCIIAFIHSCNRDQFQKIKKPESQDNKKIDIIIARFEDFSTALEIAGDTIKQTINKSSSKLMEIDQILRNMFNHKTIDNEQDITVRDIMVEANLSENRTREYLNELCDKGFAEKDENQKIHRYYPIEKKFKDLDASQITFSEHEYSSWIEEQMKTSGNSYSFVSSCCN